MEELLIIPAVTVPLCLLAGAIVLAYSRANPKPKSKSYKTRRIEAEQARFSAQVKSATIVEERRLRSFEREKH